MIVALGRRASIPPLSPDDRPLPMPSVSMDFVERSVVPDDDDDAAADPSQSRWDENGSKG